MIKLGSSSKKSEMERAWVQVPDIKKKKKWGPRTEELGPEGLKSTFLCNGFILHHEQPGHLSQQSASRQELLEGVIKL